MQWDIDDIDNSITPPNLLLPSDQAFGPSQPFIEPTDLTQLPRNYGGVDHPNMPPEPGRQVTEPPAIVPPPSLQKCTLCPETVCRRDALKRHMREKHGPPGPFLCTHPNCARSKAGRGFKRQRALDRHLASPRLHQKQHEANTRLVPPSTIAPEEATSSHKDHGSGVSRRNYDPEFYAPLAFFKRERKTILKDLKLKRKEEKDKRKQREELEKKCEEVDECINLLSK